MLLTIYSISLPPFSTGHVVAVQCDMGWCCSSDGMIIPKPWKYTEPLVCHLSPCSHTVMCLSLYNMSARDSELTEAPQ